MNAFRRCVLALLLLCSSALVGFSATSDDVQQLSLVSNDLISNPGNGKLYASVPGLPGAANSIAIVDPAIRNFVGSIPVSGTPGKLALSDDNQRLYVALVGSGQVQPIDLATNTPGTPFSLGGFEAEDIAVVPGSPNSVAVSRMNPSLSPGHEGVVVYDNGVPRTANPGYTGSPQIEFAGSRLVGYNNETTEFGFRRLSLTATGVTVDDVTPNVIYGFNVELAAAGGRVYTTSGEAVDPETRRLLGTFPGASGPVAPDPATGKVFYLGYSSSSVATIRAYDLQTYRPYGTLSVSGLTDNWSSLVRWGADGLAFRTPNQLVILRTRLLPTRPAGDLSVVMTDAPDPAVVGQNVTYTATVKNSGPDAVSGVQASFSFTGTAALISASASQGTASSGTATAQAALGTIAAGGTATFTIVVRPSAASPIRATVSLASQGLDTDQSNNAWLQETYVTSSAGDTKIGVVSLPARGLAYSKATGLIYASVPGSAGSIGNSLVPIDPLTGNVGTGTYVGSDPGFLAVSDDGQFIHAALDGAAGVSQFDAVNGTLARTFSLGIAPGDGPRWAEDIDVMPGSPETIAVSLKNGFYSPRFAGVAVYDRGVSRNNVANQISNAIEFSDQPTRLYGQNKETSEFGYRRMNVDATGVTVFANGGGVASTFNVDFDYANGKVFTTAGRVVDAEQRVAGTQLQGVSGLVCADAAANKVFYLVLDANSVWNLRAYDIPTLTFIGSVALPGISYDATGLIRWGKDGLALRTQNNQVYLIRSPLISGETPTDLELTFTASPNPVRVGNSLAYTMFVKNRSATAALRVVATDTLPAGVTLTGFNSNYATATLNNGVLTLDYGSIPAGATEQALILVRPNATGTITNTGSVAGAEPDPVPANNSATTDMVVGPRQADLTLGMTDSPDPVQAGQSLIYSLSVLNKGPDPATGVTITDTLPAGMSFQTASSPSTQNGNQVIFNLGTLAVNASVGIRLTVTPSIGGTLTNTATITGAEMDPVTGDNTASVQTTVIGPPAAPSNPTATATSSSQVTVAWVDGSSNEDGFRIERHVEGGPWEAAGTAGLDATSFQDRGRAANTRYFYRVQAYNANGSSPFTGETSALTHPKAPTALSITGAAQTTIGLAWDDANPVPAAHEVERSEDGVTFTQVAQKPAGTLTHTDSGLQPEKTYHYRVRATNSTGASGYSPVSSATTLAIRYTVSGKVMVGSSGVGGVRVSGGAGSVLTAADGSYTLTGFPAGNFAIYANTASYSFTPQSVSLGPDRTGVDFTAPAGTDIGLSGNTYTVTGKVMVGGSGVEGVRVSGGAGSVLTTADGSYTLTGFPSGNFAIYATTSSYSFTPQSVSLGPSRTGVDFTAPAGTDIGLGTSYTVSGKVIVGTSGVGGVRVSGGAGSVLTEPDGSYTLTGFPAGNFAIYANTSSYAFPPQSVSLGPSKTGVDFSASAGTDIGLGTSYTISGRVLVGGSGVGGVQVSGGAWTTYTAGDGSYTLSGFPAGNFAIYASTSSYSFPPQSASVGPSKTDVDFTAPAGTVVGLGGSTSISGSQGAVGAPGLWGMLVVGSPLTTLTAAEGTYTLPGLSGGDYRVLAMAFGYTSPDQVPYINPSLTAWSLPRCQAGS